MSLVPDGYDGRFRFAGTVLESPEHGPQLCAFVRTSLPPQCSGPDVVGWNWDGLEAESLGGTTWGSYLLIGTWDGRLELTEPARVSDRADGTEPDPGPDFTTPCPPPEGGWRPVDPARTSPEALEQVAALAAAEPDYAGFWVDQPPDADNDPARLVVNAQFTGGLSEHERELRRVWGGALCVGAADRTYAELLRIQRALEGMPGLAEGYVDTQAGGVAAQVWVATEVRQRELDERFGAGVVRLSGLLRPIDA